MELVALGCGRRLYNRYCPDKGGEEYDDARS